MNEEQQKKARRFREYKFEAFGCPFYGRPTDCTLDYINHSDQSVKEKIKNAQACNRCAEKNKKLYQQCHHHFEIAYMYATMEQGV